MSAGHDERFARRNDAYKRCPGLDRYDFLAALVFHVTTFVAPFAICETAALEHWPPR